MHWPFVRRRRLIQALNDNGRLCVELSHARTVAERALDKAEDYEAENKVLKRDLFLLKQQVPQRDPRTKRFMRKAAVEA